MYTLRRVSKKGELNIALGNSYTLLNRERNVDEFNKTIINVFKEENVHEQKVVGFVVSESGKEVHPYYEDEGNYIMTDTGKTFSCLK